jgi:bacillithiol biosynthesis deacetylase BshB1
MTARLDCLVVAAHPDDAEISCGGTLLRLIDGGRRVGVLDVTRGEMGTRGTRADRDAETRLASERLGLSFRGNLEQPDGRVQVTLEAREALARVLRETRPHTVLTHALEDSHPDHAATGRLTREAWYVCGLQRLAELDGGPPAKRPAALLHFQSHVPFEPTLVVDVTPVWERKLEVVRAYASQLRPGSPEDQGQHFLQGADILRRMETKARSAGERIGAAYGEPFLSRGPLACHDPAAWLS